MSLGIWIAHNLLLRLIFRRFFLGRLLLHLVEEVGETCRAILKEDTKEIIDGIGDCVVVLVNLAELTGTPIEKCIQAAYDEIKGRTGKMSNGTFKKD